MKFKIVTVAIASWVAMSLSVSGMMQQAEERGGASNISYPTHLSPKHIPPRDFARDPGITSASLSPNGKYFLTVAPNVDYMQVRVHSAEANNRESLFANSIPRDSYNGAYWITDDRLMIETQTWYWDYRKGWKRINTLIAVDRDGSNMERLLVANMEKSLSNVGDLLVDVLPNDPDHVLIMTEGKKKSGPSLSKLEIYTGDTEPYMEGRKGVTSWVTDHKGIVRLGIGTEDKKLKLIARPANSNEWINLQDNEVFEDGRFFPLSFTEDGNSMFVRSALANGRFAIYRFDLTSGKLTEKIFEHSDVDARGIEISGVDQRLKAVNFVTDRLERKFFDDRYKVLMDSIDHALPGRSNYVLDRTANDRFYLLYSVSDRYPGALYRFDTTEGKLRMEVLAEMNRQINPMYMSATKRVDYFARDGLEIPAYMTIPKGVEAKNLPAVILPHGGPHSRSEIEYNRVVQFLVSRGYLVLQPNYRGSTGYSYEYQTLGYGEWGAAMQNDIEDGVDYLIDEGVVDPDRVCIMGLSGYSSYAALLGVMKSKDRFRCAVAVSPIFDLAKRVKALKKNVGKTAAWRIAGDRKAKELDKVSPIKLVKQLDRPILMFHGAKDRALPLKDFEKFEKALKKANANFETMKSDDEGHGMDLPKTRTKFYRKLEKFLAESIGEGTVMTVPGTEVADASEAGQGER